MDTNVVVVLQNDSQRPTQLATCGRTQPVTVETPSDIWLQWPNVVITKPAFSETNLSIKYYILYLKFYKLIGWILI